MNNLRAQNLGVDIEHIVNEVIGSNSMNTIGGYAKADHLKNYPFDAALIIAGKIWTPERDKKIGKFLNEWGGILRDKKDYSEETFIKYKEALVELIK